MSNFAQLSSVMLLLPSPARTHGTSPRPHLPDKSEVRRVKDALEGDRQAHTAQHVRRACLLSPASVPRLSFLLFIIHLPLCYSQLPIPFQQHIRSSITSATAAPETDIQTVAAPHPPRPAHQHNLQNKKKSPTQPAQLQKPPVQTCRPLCRSRRNPPPPLASKSSRMPKPNAMPSRLMALC